MSNVSNQFNPKMTFPITDAEGNEDARFTVHEVQELILPDPETEWMESEVPSNTPVITKTQFVARIYGQFVGSFDTHEEAVEELKRHKG